MAWTERHDGSYIKRLVASDLVLYVERVDARFSARLGSERIPELFGTVEDALACADELARRRLHEALARVSAEKRGPAG